MLIFILQGTFLGALGIIFGLILGLLITLNLDYIVMFIEYIIGHNLLDSDIYMISSVPAQIHLQDLVYVSLISFIFSILATVYPSLTASRTMPAETLKGN